MRGGRARAAWRARCADLTCGADALALPAEARRNLEAGDLPVRFLDYDWSLNTASNNP